MSDDDDEIGVHTGVMRMPAPRSLMENRTALRYIFASTIRNAYEKLIEEKAITKEQIAQNMKEDPIVIDAMLKSIDLWSIEMMADFLWGMNLHVAGIMMGSDISDENEEDENDENERIH